MKQTALDRLDMICSKKVAANRSPITMPHEIVANHRMLHDDLPELHWAAHAADGVFLPLPCCSDLELLACGCNDVYRAVELLGDFEGDASASADTLFFILSFGRLIDQVL
jgi:hypothetical protein